MSTKNAVKKYSKKQNSTGSKVPAQLFANDAVKKLDNLAARQKNGPPACTKRRMMNSIHCLLNVTKRS